MSLSQEPALTALKKFFVCGTKDITDEPYAGESGRHDNFGNAVVTTNGAGPHNLQLFMLSPDGVVLNCLPGYWAPQDLVYEMQLAAQLNQVWENPKLSRAEKNAIFKKMHMEHAREHPQDMVARSHLQGFDAMYEASERSTPSDFIKNPEQVAAFEAAGKHVPPNMFKTTDQVMHERLIAHPFVMYDHFDVAAFSDYGKQRYDKHEDAMKPDGMIDHEKAAELPSLGQAKKGAGMHKEGRTGNVDHTSREWGNASRPWGVPPGSQW